jgi:hypothetical protein
MVNAAESAGFDRDVQRLLGEVAGALERLSDLGVGVEKAVQLARARQQRGIPVSIFNEHLGALESVVKYMREELALDYHSIAVLLGRNPGPIGVTYRRSKKKFASGLDTSSKESIPFEALRANKDTGLSIFESLAYYLAKQGYDWHDIARIVCRNDKTVWTVLDRAKKKMRIRGKSGRKSRK